MHDFKYVNNQLYCERVPISRIVKTVGTPIFIYSKKTLLDHYHKLDKAFRNIPHLICYSVKSNSNIAVCHTLVKAGAGLDIVSGGELYRAGHSGCAPQKIIYAGVGKTIPEIEFALKKNILFFTVESIPELELLNRCAGKLKKQAPVVLRINPNIAPGTHRYITTGKKETKFGIDLAACRQLYLGHKKYTNIEFVGAQIHIGSQITNPRPYLRALKRIIPLVKEIKKKIPSFKYLDIGGGLGIVYKEEKPATAEQFANAVLPLVEKLGLEIIIEPGRFIAGNSGILAVKVLYLKQTPVKTFIITDGGMNDLIRPSLYSAYHAILPTTKSNSKTITADIVGPICESSDFFANKRLLPRPRPGQYLAIMGAGAYGFSMSSNYNSRPRAAEVLVDKNVYFIIRSRETYDDLIAKENIPAKLF